MARSVSPPAYFFSRDSERLRALQKIFEHDTAELNKIRYAAQEKKNEDARKIKSEDLADRAKFEDLGGQAKLEDFGDRAKLEEPKQGKKRVKYRRPPKDRFGHIPDMPVGKEWSSR